MRMTPNALSRFSSGNTFIKVLGIFFALIVGGLITLDSLFTRTGKAFNTASDLVTHARHILGKTDTILLLAQDLQWEARNYSFTGDTNAYHEYFIVRDSLQSSTQYLQTLVTDNRYQNENTVNLQERIAGLIRFTDSSIASRRQLNNMPSNMSAYIKQHNVLHNSIKQQVDLINSEEKHLLAARRADAVTTIDSVYNIYIASGTLVLILLVGTFAFVFYHFRKRQKAEQGLIESEQRFQTLVNSTEDLAIFLTDDKGNIIDWYAGAHKVKGYDKEEVIGKNVSIFYSEEAVESGEPQRNLEMATKQGSFETEGWRIRKDGSRFWADVLITAVYDRDGKLKGFTKVTRDFSLHRMAEEETKKLLQKEKDLNHMKSNFVSIASHEFRTPLSTILSSISLLEKYRTTETQSKREQHIFRIKSSIKELVSTLDEFLSLEKIEEGKVQAKKEIFNIKELSEHLHSRFNSILKPGQVIIYKHSGDEDVFLDEVFTSHIVNNLLSNAVKYSPDSTQILFETCMEAGNLSLKVKDEGIGISEEDQKHLFERFFRASNTGSAKGTGLGLHIAKKFVDLMDGQIHVTSEINKGTEFNVIFESVCDLTE